MPVLPTYATACAVRVPCALVAGYMEKVEEEEEEQLKGEEAGGKKKTRKNLPSRSTGRGDSPAVAIITIPVAAAAVDVWEEEEGKRGVRGDSAVAQQFERLQVEKG